jgi:protein O-GlcNAc transferase
MILGVFFRIFTKGKVVGSIAVASIAEVFSLAWRHYQAGNVAEAEQYCRQVVQVDPGHADAHQLLGALAYQRGHYDLAVSSFRQALFLTPSAEAHFNLANALNRQGKVQDALSHWYEALGYQPDLPNAHNNLASALLNQGKLDEAVRHSRLALRSRPDYPEAHNNLAGALQLLGQYQDAVAHARRALRLKPDYAHAHSNLGHSLGDLGLLDEAVASLRHAIHLDPGYVEAFNNLGNVLKDQGRLDEAIECYQQCRKLDPAKQMCHSNLFFCMPYHPRYNSRAISEELRCWELVHAQCLADGTRSFTNDRSPQRRLRIGYVSADFYDHVVGSNIWPLLRNHDRSQFEITLYANQARSDSMTEKFRKSADAWLTIAGWPDSQVADRILQDGIDILVDLAVHSSDNRLLVFARKPAPVQVTFAGYPGSTGLRAIDYRLTDSCLDPPGMNDGCYAEESYRLPHSFWCFDPQTTEPPVAPLPALQKGFITFGCLNRFCKVNDEVLHLWGQVLRAVKRSRLLLLAPPGSHRQRTRDFLVRQGIDAERLEFCSRKRRFEYLSLYHQVDLMLDTFPYNGHSTTLDALWMGVPVITLVGSTVVGRAGLSQLTNLGLEELAARTPDDYVRLAVDWAGDLARLQILRSGLRERMKRSPLMDAAGFTRGIEAAYRAMWRKWCGNTPQAAPRNTP